jgi:predicted ATPase
MAQQSTLFGQRLMRDVSLVAESNCAPNTLVFHPFNAVFHAFRPF